MGHKDLVIYPLPPSSKWGMKNIQDLYVHNQYEACFHLMTPLFKTRIKILVPSECDSRIIVVHHLLSVFDNFSDSRVIVVQQLHSGFDNF